jgi:hypothetical protein
MPAMRRLDRTGPRHAHGPTRVAARLGLGGPPPAWPVPVDRICLGWSRLPPRLRLFVVIGLTTTLLAATRVQVHRAESRWGGPPVTVWVATADAGVGEVADLRRVRLPPGAVPPSAVERPGTRPLTMALPEGAVLTTAHLAAEGPAVGLPQGSRLVPIPVEAGWGVSAGARVDVWVEGSGTGARLVAAGRSVVEVRAEDEGSGHATALVALERDQVPAVTSALAQGAVLLSIVPGA